MTPQVEGTNWWNRIDQPPKALYLLDADPYESDNVFDARPDIAASLHTILKRHLTADTALRKELGPAGSVPVVDNTTQLEALGYIEGSRRGSDASAGKP